MTKSDCLHCGKKRNNVPLTADVLETCPLQTGNGPGLAGHNHTMAAKSPTLDVTQILECTKLKLLKYAQKYTEISLWVRYIMG